MAGYTYQALESPKTIRILVLHPASTTASPLRCSLKHAQRADEAGGHYNSPDYIAISYVWGHPVFNHNIYIDGSFLAITQNVDTMLRDLRKPLRSRSLWIDAICLNQSDFEEKRVQIPLMGEIYREATKVKIWLAPPTGTRQDETLELIKRFSLGHRPEAGSAEWSLIDDFLKDSWWKRRFTIQEGMVNCDTSFRYCGHSIQRERLRQCLEVSQSSQEWAAFDQTATVRLSSATKPDDNLLDLILRYHDTECAEIQDKIGALHGLVHRHAMPGAMSLFTIDYSRHWKYNFQAFVLACIADFKYADLGYHLKTFGSMSVFHPDVPAWVPNWHRPRHDGNGLPPIIEYEKITFLDHIPDARAIFAQAFQPSVSLGHLGSWYVSRITTVIPPSELLDYTVTSLNNTLISLAQALDTGVVSVIRDIAVRNVDVDLKIESTRYFIIGALLRDYLRTCLPLVDEVVEDCIAKTSDTGAADGCAIALKSQFDILYMQMLFNDCLLPLMRFKLTHWFFFKTANGAIGSAPHPLEVGQFCSRQDLSSVDETAFICKLPLGPNGLASGSRSVISPCTVTIGPKLITTWDTYYGPVDDHMETLPKRLQVFATEWEENNPWRSQKEHTRWSEINLVK